MGNLICKIYANSVRHRWWKIGDVDYAFKDQEA